MLKDQIASKKSSTFLQNRNFDVLTACHKIKIDEM